MERFAIAGAMVAAGAMIAAAVYFAGTDDDTEPDRVVGVSMWCQLSHVEIQTELPGSCSDFPNVNEGILVTFVRITARNPEGTTYEIDIARSDLTFPVELGDEWPPP